MQWEVAKKKVISILKGCGLTVLKPLEDADAQKAFLVSLVDTIASVDDELEKSSPAYKEADRTNPEFQAHVLMLRSARVHY